MAVIQDEQGNNKPIKTDTSHVFDVNGNPLHGELFIGETIAEEDVEEIDGFAHESEVAELKNNVAGSQISLESYTSATNKYTFLNDGYIYINSGSATSSAIRVVVADASGTAFITKYIPLTSAVIRDALFVRKGMSAYCDNVPSGSTIKFVPLISYQ